MPRSGVVLGDVMPAFARELEEGLRSTGHEDLADQVPGLRVTSLCGCGDAFCASFYIGMRGATDDVVLARAASEQRVLITTDTDFGTIWPYPGPPGQACYCSEASVTPSTSEPTRSSTRSRSSRTI